jgi:hypothetical protein
MPLIRFATARSLFEAFPELREKLTVAPTDEAPIAFLQNLSAQEKFEDAVAFCAHLLPRREAVWWGCGNAKAFLGDAVSDRNEGLHAAEAWVYEPTEQNRLAALEVGNRADSSQPLTWLALGAGWSGGTLNSHPKTPVPMPQYMTARAIRIATLLAAQHVAQPERAGRFRASIEEGIKLAETGL